MSVGRRSKNATYAPTHRFVAATTDYNCITNSPDGATCAWKVVLLAAGNFTQLRDADGIDRPFNGAPANFAHEADVSRFTASVDAVVYF